MMNTIEQTSTVAARKARWKQFLAPGAKPGFLFFVNYNDPEAKLAPGCHPWPENAKQRIESAWSRYEWQMKKVGWIHDDRIPFLDNTTGTEVFAEALGCKVERPEHTMPFANACVRTPEEASKIKVPELSRSSLAYLFDIADELHRRSGPGACMKLIDVQSPMDVAALVWKKEELFIAMIESPDAVKELAAKARNIMIAFFDEWFRRYGTEYICHCPEYFMNGGLTLSEDEIGTVNADMMEEFFLPELEILSQRYGGLGIHCCADSMHQWENFRRIPGLRLLNLHTPPKRNGNEFIGASFKYFGASIAHAPGWNPAGDPLTWPDQVPADCRLIFQIPAKDREQAIAITEALNGHPRRFSPTILWSSRPESSK